MITNTKLNKSFKGIWSDIYQDMKANNIRVREKQRLALNKAARRAVRNSIKRDTIRAIKEYF